MRFSILKRSAAKLLSLILTLSLMFASSVRAVEIVVSENGSGSESQTTVDSSTSTNIEQTNVSNIENSVDLSSNTGDNNASDNTGTTQITTGDTTTSVNLENSTNYSQVNAGDCCQTSDNIAISGNGTESENSVTLNEVVSNTTLINQTANISNTIQGYANTGNNTADNNSGDVTINTGDINVEGSIINAPINISSVETAGGGGSHDVLINGNGSGSENKIYADFISNNNITLNQYASIINDVSWDLDTGNNSANGNNGNVSISTGDISLDFFITNFVNLGGIKIDSCCKEKPEDPTDGEEVINSPSQGGNGGGGGGGGGGNGGSSSGDGGGGGVLLSQAAATGPGVVGLSDTSSRAAQAVFFWVGLGLIMIGLKFVTGEITSKKLAKRRLNL